jgi:asparagine synthase (glutamine-hydrolysing)
MFGQVGIGAQSKIAEAMSRSVHRGPDGQGSFADDLCALGHLRLAIIDLEGGQQPLFDADHRYVLVANGEVYNFRELREQHERAGCRYLTGSDSEAILHALALGGVPGVDTLRGMYAFALYDKVKRTLVLARDRFGIKPLFYAQMRGQVFFASELKALLAMLPNVPEVSARGLLQYLQNQFVSGRETIFEGVFRVLPGESLTFFASLNVRSDFHWSTAEVTQLKLAPEKAESQLEGLFEQTMREHVRSDVPLGLFLSGGVDSAVLLSLLAEYSPYPLKTYSVGYKDTHMQGELPAAERIAHHFNAEHTSLTLGSKEIMNRLVHATWAADDLMWDYASLPTSLLSELASKDLKVVFSGEGGDEVFAGYRRYRNNLERRFKSLVYPQTQGFRSSGRWRGLRARQTFGSTLWRVRRVRREPFVQAWRSCPDDWGYLRRAQYTDLVTALPDNLLVKVDRMMMSFGLEGRVPFLDHRIVNYGLSLPDILKRDGTMGKRLLRAWAARRIPKEHLYGKKRGFYVPVGDWLKGDFLTKLEGKLRASPVIRDWFHAEGVRKLFRAQECNRSAAREIMMLSQFAVWHRLFVEGPYVRPSNSEDLLDWIT